MVGNELASRPLLPCSRDRAKLRRIKRDLAVYRLAF